MPIHTANMRISAVNLPINTANSLIAFRLQPLYNFLIAPKSKFVDFCENIKYDGIGIQIRIAEGGIIMTANEKELIKLIRENDNPEQALMTAAVIILGYLKQHESFEVQAPVCLRELV